MNIHAFRRRLAASAAIEPTDPAPVLAWLEERRRATLFKAELIPVRALRGWRTEAETGNVVHDSGAFFAVQGVRIDAGGQREVGGWDQPIYTQPSGGVLAILAAERDGILWFLLNAKAEPGNIATLQLSPTIQASRSSLEQRHGGKAPPLAEFVIGADPARIVYDAGHCEEGSRFWLKENRNLVVEADYDAVGGAAGPWFAWASLSQIKAMMLLDNVINPYVKTVLAPL